MAIKIDMLRVFRAVAETGSVAHAAEQLGDIERLDDGARPNVAEQRKLAPFLARDWPVGADQQDVRLDTDRAKFFDGMLRWVLSRSLTLGEGAGGGADCC